MTFEKVLNGIVKYLDSELYTGLNDWQELFARIFVSRVIGNEEVIKNALINNAFIRTFGIVDGDGNVDVDGLMRDIRTQIEKKGKMTITLPMFGKFTFTPEDIDKLHNTIKESNV